MVILFVVWCVFDHASAVEEARVWWEPQIRSMHLGHLFETSFYCQFWVLEETQMLKGHMLTLLEKPDVPYKIDCLHQYLSISVSRGFSTWETHRNQ